MAAWTELPPTGGLPECAALVRLAERLRWSAAELVIQYANRALAESAAEGGPLAVRAQALVAAALVRVGRHADAVEPALAALRDADQAGVPELIPTLRLDLAACAHGLGESLLGCTILRPVLENTGGRPSTRAIAITALVGCTAHVGRRDDLEDSLAEAERLLAADDALTPDTRRMERAQLAMRTAAYYRRYGETEDAVEAARDGLGLLTKLRDPRLEGGLARAGLTLELVCALLDDGELAEAERVAEPLLAEPVRSSSAAAVGRLMLAMVTRVHVPAGRVEHGRSLLGHATWIAERHDHDWLLADAHTTLAQLDEASGQPADALLELRAARVAEQRQLRRVDVAKRLLMIEFGIRPMPLDTVNSLLRNVVRAPVSAAPAPGTPAKLPAVRPSLPASPVPERPGEPEPADTDAATGLLTREGLSRRIQAVRSTNRPVALTLVRLDPVDADGRVSTDQDAPAAHPGAPDALTTLAGRVRDIAPEDAELARSAGSELAVLLPHTTRDQAEVFAATIRESAIESDWLTEASGQEVSISTGVAQSGPATDEDADSLLTAARETLTTAEADRPGPAPPSSDDLFLSTLEAAASDTGAGYREIRDLLAPLLGHPTLKRTAPTPRPDPDPDPTLPLQRRPLPGTDTAPPPTTPPESTHLSHPLPGDNAAPRATTPPGPGAESVSYPGDDGAGGQGESGDPGHESVSALLDRLPFGGAAGRREAASDDLDAESVSGPSGGVASGQSASRQPGGASGLGLGGDVVHGQGASGDPDGESVSALLDRLPSGGEAGRREPVSHDWGAESMSGSGGDAARGQEVLRRPGGESGLGVGGDVARGPGSRDPGAESELGLSGDVARGQAASRGLGAESGLGGGVADGQLVSRQPGGESGLGPGGDVARGQGASRAPEEESVSALLDRLPVGGGAGRPSREWGAGGGSMGGERQPDLEDGADSSLGADGEQRRTASAGSVSRVSGAPVGEDAARASGGLGAEGSRAVEDELRSALLERLPVGGDTGRGEADGPGADAGPGGGSLEGERQTDREGAVSGGSVVSGAGERRRGSLRDPGAESVSSFLRGLSDGRDAGQEGADARRQTVPSEPEPDDFPEPPRRPDIIVPKEPDAFPVAPEEPEAIPPVRPGTEPLPEVPPPTTIPAAPAAPEPERTEPEPSEPEEPPTENRLEPVKSPDSRFDEPTHRSLRRPERTDRTSIADLLTEALVAYQETTPDEEPEPAVPEPVPHERMYYERPPGRHRMPDWDGGV